MGEITFPTSQTFCERLCHFFKWFVCPESSGDKTAGERFHSSRNEFSNDVFNEDISSDNEYLVLTCIAQNPVLNNQLCYYRPIFSSSIRMRVFSETISPWNLALKRRRLERNCREYPFVRYDIKFVNDELKNLWSKRLVDKNTVDEHFSPADENPNDGFSLTRSPSPCRSSSTLSSAYSSEELSTISSVSQYSCLFTSEMSSQEEVVGAEAFSDIQATTPQSVPLCNLDEKDPYNCSSCHKSSLLNDVENDHVCIEDARLRSHIERAFKYCKLFEILEHPSNRFRISLSSCGLGLPLTHLDRCWPPVSAVGNLGYHDQKESKRRSTWHGRRQRRDYSEEQANCAYLRLTEPRHIPDGLTLQYDSSPDSFDQGNFCVSKMDVLSEEIWDYHISVMQSEEILNLKMQLRDVLYSALSQLFPMCGLYIVGSSLNGFGTNSSDMDLCLMISCKEINQRTDAVVVLDLVRNLFKNMNFLREQKLIIAKVPILRMHFYEPYANIVVDLNANNSVAIRNTQLLCYYSYYDWRVRPLVSVVKEWAKRRDINDANRSSFTSYSLVLMVIHYLQCEARILPSLQEKYPKVFNQRLDVRTLSVSLPLEPQGFCQEVFDCRDRPTLGELLLGFFEYFATKFDYANDAISVRLGQKIERRFVASQPSSYSGRMSQWNYICIEEPFNYSNTAHSVHDQYVFDKIRFAFVEDYEKLEHTRDLHAFLNINSLNNSCCLLESSRRTNSSETLLNVDTETSTTSTSSSIVDCQDISVRESKSENSSNSDDFVDQWRSMKSHLISAAPL